MFREQSPNRFMVSSFCKRLVNSRIGEALLQLRYRRALVNLVLGNITTETPTGWTVWMWPSKYSKVLRNVLAKTDICWCYYWQLRATVCQKYFCNRVDTASFSWTVDCSQFFCFKFWKLHLTPPLRHCTECRLSQGRNWSCFAYFLKFDYVWLETSVMTSNL